MELLVKRLNAGVLPPCPARVGRRLRRPRPARTSRAAARRRGPAWVEGELLPGAEASPASASSRSGSRQGGPVARSTARSSWRRWRARPRPGAPARGTADVACALSLEALQGSRTSSSRRSRRCARSRGQGASAANVLRLLDDSAINEAPAGATRCRTPTRCAAPRRCTGPRATCSTTSTYTVEMEVNAATDNPLVLVEDELLVSNGNFHRQPVAFALDAMAMAVAELTTFVGAPRRRLVNPNLLRRPAGVPDRQTSSRK